MKKKIQGLRHDQTQRADEDEPNKGCACSAVQCSAVPCKISTPITARQTRRDCHLLVLGGTAVGGSAGAKRRADSTTQQTNKQNTKKKQAQQQKEPWQSPGGGGGGSGRRRSRAPPTCCSETAVAVAVGTCARAQDTAQESQSKTKKGKALFPATKTPPSHTPLSAAAVHRQPAGVAWSAPATRLV